MSQEVPIPEKLLLTIKEAAIYSNIGINRIDSMLRKTDARLFFLLAVRSW